MGADTHLSSHNNIFKMLKTIYANISAEWYRYIEHTHTVYVYLLSPFSFFLPLLPCQHKRPYAVSIR